MQEAFPHACRFRRPRGEPDPRILLSFLGRDFNNDFTSLTLPTIRPPRAIDFLPVVGSGGIIVIIITIIRLTK